MFPEKTFPLQQGAMDSLCAVYSVLNCLNALGELDCPEHACALFRSIVPKLGRPVNAVLDGFSPGTERYSDIKWLGQEAAQRNLLEGPVKLDSGDDLARRLDASDAGGVIFFRDIEARESTHYTYVKKRRADGVFPLWDSYGFSLLVVTLDSSFADGHAIEVTHFWEAVPKR